MRKRTIINVCRYIIKGLIILLPLILLFTSYWNAYTPQYPIINYLYNTNDVSSQADLVDGNIYSMDFDLGNGIVYSSFQMPIYDFYNYTYDTSYTQNGVVASTSTYNYNVPGLRFINSSSVTNRTSFIVYILKANSGSSNGIQSLYGHVHIDFVYKDTTGLTIPSDIMALISRSDYNVIENVQMIGLRGELFTFFEDFKGLSINSWYSEMLNVFGFDFNLNTALGFCLIMPLWILWVWLFDIMLDFMLFIPKLCHNYLNYFYQSKE